MSGKKRKAGGYKDKRTTLRDLDAALDMSGTRKGTAPKKKAKKRKKGLLEKDEG